MTEPNTELIESLENFAHIINETQGKATITMLNGDIFQEAANEIRELHKTINAAIKLLQEKPPYQNLTEHNIYAYIQHTKRATQ